MKTITEDVEMIKKILEYFLPEVVDHSATIRVGDYGGGLVYTNKDTYYSEFGNVWQKKSNGSRVFMDWKYNNAMQRFIVAEIIRELEKS